MVQSTSQVYDLLPAPFAWIEIPAGKVTLINDWDDDPHIYLTKNEKNTFDVPAFAIAKYPVTNAQFSRFIDAKGYDNRLWWTDAGWRAKTQGMIWDADSESMKPTEQPWTQPRYWSDPEWNGADYPVVGVSWHEALAFCRWLSAVSGENILLPTEQQWQRAAQGDDNRTYPWGNEWDGSHCNNSVKPFNSFQTTSVTQFEGRGHSPFGVVDMTGNVWEWCLTNYDSGSNVPLEIAYRVIRGGSWFDNANFSFRVSFRYWRNPGYWEDDIGLRIVRLLP